MYAYMYSECCERNIYFDHETSVKVDGTWRIVETRQNVLLSFDFSKLDICTPDKHGTLKLLFTLHGKTAMNDSHWIS